MKNQIVIITGASSGIGKTTASTLIKAGYTVYAVARRLEHMEDLKAIGARTLKMDITKDEDVQSVVDVIIKEQGRIDILINNAGFGLYGSVEEVTIEAARYQYEVNLFGLARITQLILPFMRAQKSGKIVNVSSMGGKIYMPFGAWYHSTKHALEGWSDSLRLEVKPFGIDVIIIEPGIIETEFGDVMSEPLMKISGNGAYADLAHKMARTTAQSYKPGNGSPSSLIANTILKAIQSKSPQTRYLKGKFAKLMVYIRKWLGDKAFDSIVMSQIK
ncbi:oxidoreductase [bacterium]|nr:MAG: oxidoreductase [bacterium]